MQQRRRRRAFTDTFKAEVVELSRRSDRPVAEVSRELDLTERDILKRATVFFAGREACELRIPCGPVPAGCHASNGGPDRNWPDLLPTPQ